ncbi:hypothetical protein BDP27DRAFT_1375525 [Rhodocollybia butyracea]|uniref:Secreted protein n=1 Tax=Rhodocollybia butyracea TaxID=206335 RepID=A0A9P5P1Z1_9AGAR|nr:hypothetical protein BDP27DRAFT_1375525 [Rhodocollybia butyracea]
MYKAFAAIFALFLVQSLAIGGASAQCTSSDDVAAKAHSVALLVILHYALLRSTLMVHHRVKASVGEITVLRESSIFNGVDNCPRPLLRIAQFFDSIFFNLSFLHTDVVYPFLPLKDASSDMH